MKSELLSIFAAGLLASTAVFTSCNDDTPDDTELIYGSTQVKSFSLKANTNVLSALDSVFFSIDLVNAQIFNADSLPYGTKVSNLVLNITTDACSKVELSVPRKNASDTVINYLTNSTDSVDFSNGPVRLHLVSYDGKAERDYTIKVNVHTVVPDSLYWNQLAMRRLPSGMVGVKAQKSVKYGDKVVCLTTNGVRYNVATTDNPYNDDWQVSAATFDFVPDVNSLSATDDALYILSGDGTLYTSGDGLSWTSTSQKWHNIYGGYRNTLLGVMESEAGYMLVTWPETARTAAPSDFPVDGTSPLCELSSKWTTEPQVVMLGGRNADGQLLRSVWGYDGKNWAKLSKTFPTPIADASMFDYTITQTDTLTWRQSKLSVLIAMCGEDEIGLNRKVYVSRNSGLDWKEGDDLVQLPSYIDSRSKAQAIVVDNLATLSRSSSQWREYQPKPLPRWWQPVTPQSLMSRSVAPVTEWEVPYIYLFGGYDALGSLYDTVWRGVINSLTFKPLQ